MLKFTSFENLYPYTFVLQMPSVTSCAKVLYCYGVKIDYCNCYYHDSGTYEEVISSQKMIVVNARNVLKKRPSYLGAPVHVTALSYSPSKGPFEEITMMLANCMGEVTGGNTNIAKKLIIIRYLKVQIKLTLLIRKNCFHFNPFAQRTQSLDFPIGLVFLGSLTQLRDS